MGKYKKWDNLASKYNKLWVQKYSLSPTRNKVLQTLKNMYTLRSEFRILDIGCGTGQLAKAINEVFPNAIYQGIDVSMNMIEKAREANTSKFNFMNCGIEDFHIEEKYDVIVCTHAFPYFPNKENVINKIYNMLNETGMFIIANACENNVYDNIAMFFVKFTTSKADYISINKIKELLETNHFKNIEADIIKEKFYMPTICYITSTKRSAL